jgi:hypothetical protein
MTDNLSALRSLVEQMRENCADAAAQDAQVIVTSLGNIQDGDATGEELDRAIKAAMRITKRIRALPLPTDAELEKVLERAVLEARIEEAKWWHIRSEINGIHKGNCICEMCERIASHEQVLAKLSKPAGGQNGSPPPASKIIETHPNCPDCGRKAMCPKCDKVATYQTPDKTFWDDEAHWWRCECFAKTLEQALAKLNETAGQSGEK